jgi:hypothetical protein
MPTQWCYGSLVVVPVAGQLLEKPLTFALLTDVQGTRIICQWVSDPSSNSDLYTAKDALGKEGWIIGEARWIRFTSQGTYVNLNDNAVPDWIKNLVQSPATVSAVASGYSEYPLRRPLT